MARRIVHQLVDDIDGNVLEVGEGETVRFSLDGTAYEIDLGDSNAKALRDAFEPFIQAAREVSAGAARGAAAAKPRKRSSQRDYSEIREWAKANGHTVSARGRVPAAVVEAYDAAH